MASRITVKKDGDQLGCTDTGAPENYTPVQLSMVHNLLLAAQQLGDEANLQTLTAQIFRLLPEMLKLEYNYSNWKYVGNRSINLTI